MATDATGAPTSLGVPKYNTSADAPSGLGFNAAMDSIDALLATRVSKPASISTGEVPVWNGSAFVRSSVTNVGPSSLGSGTPDATTTLSGSGAWVKPSGYEINYSQIVSPVTIASTTEATGTTIIAPGAITFDGGLVMVEFYSPQIVYAQVAGSLVIVSLFEGATQIGRFDVNQNPVTGPFSYQAAGRLRFTPSAGSHTYTVTAFATSLTGTPQVISGAGGTGTPVPSFVRFTKV